MQNYIYNKQNKATGLVFSKCITRQPNNIYTIYKQNGHYLKISAATVKKQIVVRIGMLRFYFK
jgi:hypothetical protein